MSFLDAIEQIQKKSEEVRRRILFFGTILFTAIILIVWTMVSSFTLFERDEVTTVTVKDGTDLSASVGRLGDITKGVVNEISSGYIHLQEQIVGENKEDEKEGE